MNRGGEPERRLGQRRVRQRGQETPGRRTGHERRRAEGDHQLHEIRKLYRRLNDKQYRSSEYKAISEQIRALVDARTAIRGDEMILVADVPKSR